MSFRIYSLGIMAANMATLLCAIFGNWPGAAAAFCTLFVIIVDGVLSFKED